MKCEQVQQRLSEYVDRVLDPESHAAVEGHLSSCPHCQAEAHALTETRRVVSNLPSVEPPYGFSQKVMAKIREEAEKPSLWQRLLLPLKIKIPIHAMAILLVAGLALYLYQANQPLETELQSMQSRSEPQAMKDLAPPASAPSTLLENRPKGADEVGSSPPLASPLRRGMLEEQSSVGGTREETRPDSAAETLGISPGAGKQSKSGTLPMAPTSQFVQQANIELTFSPKEPLEGMKGLTQKLEDLVKRVGGEYLPSDERNEKRKRNLLLEPQRVWLIIPENHYGQLRTELASLGNIESESQLPPSALTPLAKVPSPLRIKLTIFLPKNKGKTQEIDQPIQ